ncbi:MAG: L-fucose/L-arabinose isomerase family protein [Pirellulales bacterium]|nr:L-fucose/L-arabinose isomerase family protein [Pirellulales bacterium]
MGENLLKPRIGVLALTLELYEQLAPSLRPRREQWLREEVLPALATIAADVRFSEADFRREDIDATVARFDADECDAIVVICLSYSPSQIALPALKRTRLPIVLWNVQELLAVDESYDGERLTHNHGVHGTQDLANVLLRAGVPFHYVTSHLSDPNALAELETFFTASAAVAGLRRCRLGLLGYPFPDMGDFAVDTTHLIATLGCSCETLSLEEYHQRAEAASPADVKRLADEYRNAYDVAKDVTEDDLALTARAEISLRSIVTERRLDGLSFQFLAFGQDERTETLPFVAISRMMSEGVGFAGEGDVVGAAGTWFLNRLCPPASFSEIFTIDFAGNGVLLSHMGEANVAMARKDRKMRLVARPTPITRTRGRQLSLVNAFEPGPATLCALALGPGHRWRLVASQVDIQDFGPLPTLPTPHSKITTRDDVRQWLTRYALAGGPHHNAICFGDARPQLRMAASLLDADYCEV